MLENSCFFKLLNLNLLTIIKVWVRGEYSTRNFMWHTFMIRHGRSTTVCLSDQ